MDGRQRLDGSTCTTESDYVGLTRKNGQPFEYPASYTALACGGFQGYGSMYFPSASTSPGNSKPNSQSSDELASRIQPEVQCDALDTGDKLHTQPMYVQNTSMHYPSRLANLLDDGIMPAFRTTDTGMIEAPPSLGSAVHPLACKPCAFFHFGSCGNGFECEFCHICEAGEKKRRKQEKAFARKWMRQLHQAWPFIPM